ncbi:MAG TPA: AraC family transcriptional regulator [Blastocatellia bacterium]
MSFLSKATAAHCAQIAEQLNQAKKLAQTNRRIETVIEFLQANVHLDLPLDFIAKEAGLSSPRLRGLFKESTGISLGHYLKLLRLETARRLLEDGFPTIQEVMDRVGIHDLSHFNRDFKAVYEVTPAKYRDHYRRNLDILDIVSE